MEHRSESTPGICRARNLLAGHPYVLALLLVAATPAGAGPGAAAADSTSAIAPRAAVTGAARRSVMFQTHTMGTYAHILVVTADSVAAIPAVEGAFAALHRVDSLMSNWTTTSEVARVNRIAGHETTTLQPEVATVVDTSLRLWRESEGAFDITVEPLVRLWGFLGGPRRVPSNEEIRTAFRRVGAQRVHYDPAHRAIRFDGDSVKIDLGGIAKGYGVDAAARALKAAGVTDALVDLTGNMFAIGTPAGADHWRIGIRDPRDRLPFFARVDLRPEEGISTSAKYEQFVAQNGRTYGHIMDPRTGWPAEGLISVTVISPSGFECDAWDTPMFVLGPAGARRKAKERTDLAVVLVQPGDAGVDTVWVQASLRNRFTLEPEARDKFQVVFF
jgi:thiamine biosynthesis lipoprotein